MTERVFTSKVQFSRTSVDAADPHCISFFFCKDRPIVWSLSGINSQRINNIRWRRIFCIAACLAATTWKLRQAMRASSHSAVTYVKGRGTDVGKEHFNARTSLQDKQAAVAAPLLGRTKGKKQQLRRTPFTLEVRILQKGVGGTMRPLVSRKSKMDASIVLGCWGERQFACESTKATYLQEDATKEKNIATFSMTKPKNGKMTKKGRRHSVSTLTSSRRRPNVFANDM